MGFVKLNDNLKNWAWFGDVKTVFVYVRLMYEAVWQDTDIGNVHLERGQALIKQTDFANRLKLTRQEFRTALNRLKSTNKITVKATNTNSIITILDYDCDTNETTNGITNQQPTSNQTSLLNTNIQTIRQPEIRAPAAREEGLSESFDKFWNAYPKKTAKQNAQKAWKKLNPDEELLNKMLASLERQKKSAQWTKDDGQFIPYPATWLNNRRWEDENTEVNTSGNYCDDIRNRTLEDWLK